MGYAECGFIMESRTGRDSSGLGCRPGMRRQTLKSSPFCPPSTSRLTQSIIKDHMMSHYKKVYSAKAAIDTSVPKSLTHSIKYNDQIRQDRLRKEGRPQSAHSLSQKNTRASCSSAQSRLSVQYDDSPYLCSRSSMVSSPRFSTSFHAKEIVYPSYNVVSKNHSHHTRPASEIRYRSSEAALHRKQSAWSLGASGVQNCYKTFQDPVQKTYSGDLLQKHSQHFTKDKPFTPKTLNTEKTSYLSQYRYYRAPLKKPTQDCNISRLMRQDRHGSTKIREYSQEFDEPAQGFNTEFEGSDSELNGTYFVAPRQESRAKESREHYLFDSSSRASSDNGKSPVMMSISAEEEELLYLEFISAVTEDILSRGHISDRVLDLVINRHIDMNRGQLDEGKMRHLLDVLRKDFEKPINMSTSSTELEKKENDLLDTFLPHLESEDKQMKTKEDNDLLPYASLIEYCDTPNYSDFLSGFTTLGSSKSTASPTKSNKKDEEGDIQEKLSELITNNAETSEDDFLPNQTLTSATSKEITDESNEYAEYTALINDEECHQDQADVSYEGQLKELEDLEKGFSESLNISNNAGSNTVEPGNEQHVDVAASVSDDDF